MSQMLLFQDPRPLVDRLGLLFFRQAPECAGVYLMRDQADVVLYVGKAKNLRKRLASYRVANPDRLPRRHLRLLRAVQRIELQKCADESSALVRESELLLALRPRFNRAGTWPGTSRFLSWRLAEGGLELAVTSTIQPGWQNCGPHGASATPVRAALIRLLWCALEPHHRLWQMPAGWFKARHGDVATIAPASPQLEDAGKLLDQFFAGNAEPLAAWVRDRTLTQAHPLEMAMRETDLETVTAFASRHCSTTTRLA